MKEIIEIKIKGGLGLLGLAGGVAVSLNTVEIWFRLLSLALGCVVAILSIYSIWLTIKRKWRREDKENEPDTDL